MNFKLPVGKRTKDISSPALIAHLFMQLARAQHLLKISVTNVIMPLSFSVQSAVASPRTAVQSF